MRAADLETNSISFPSRMNSSFWAGGGSAGDTVKHANLASELLSQEVTNLDHGVSLRNGYVDGEMSVYRAHLVLVSLDDSLEHVLNVGADCADSSKLLFDAEPFFNQDGVLGVLADIDGQMLELATKGTTGSFDNDATRLDLDLHLWWDLDGL